MQPSNDLAPLAVFVVGMVAFIVEHQAPAAARRDTAIEVVRLGAIGRWLGSQNRQHLLRLDIVGSHPLVKLLDVGQVKRTLGSGPLLLTPHVAVEVPINLQLRRNYRVHSEDSTSLEVRPEPFKDD